MKTCIYLRKSREDIEAEKRGQGETLSKHRRTLLDVAKQRNLTIAKIHEEIVTGESISGRPEMQKMLEEIIKSEYDAVLVMDIDRLGRGKLQDQGIILDAFKESKTKIITPRKLYDLDNEMDEEYSEFEAFMARKELKIINRRLQRGRVRSVMDGNYIGTYAPYGYDFSNEGKERILIPHSTNAPVVKMIFELYLSGLGGTKIANKLNEMGYKSYTGIEWRMSSVIFIIKNSLYAGYLKWVNNGEKITAKGKHQPLISEDIYNRAQEMLIRKTHVPYNVEIKNPLAGLIFCKHCGNKMIQRPYKDKDDQIMCVYCNKNKSSKAKYIENRILEILEEITNNYKINKDIPLKDDSDLNTMLRKLKELEKELEEAEKQKNKLHDLLEKNIYDVDTYLERSNVLADRIRDIKKSIESVNRQVEIEQLKTNSSGKFMPQISTVISTYRLLDDIRLKNILLKTVIDKIEYYKSKDQRNDQFDILVYTRVDKVYN